MLNRSHISGFLTLILVIAASVGRGQESTTIGERPATPLTTEAEVEQLRAEQNAQLELMIERDRRFGALPEDAPADVQKAYAAIVEDLRESIAKLRSVKLQFDVAVRREEEQLDDYTEAIEQGQAAFSTWIDKMAGLYASDPTRYSDFGLTLMEVLRLEGQSDRTMGLTSAARTILDNPPSRLDNLLLQQIGYIAFSQKDFELSRRAWDMALVEGQLHKDYQPLYASLEQAESARTEFADFPEDVNPDNPLVELHTSKGILLIELFEDVAPNAVANFIYLVENDFYKRMRFFRVIEHFGLQSGCIQDDGTTNAGYTIEADEISERSFATARGSVFFALGYDASGQPNRDSGGSQFLITTTPVPALDGQVSVFGRVVGGRPALGTFLAVDLSEEEQRKQRDLKTDYLIKAEVIRKRDHEYKPAASAGRLPY